MSNLRDRLIAAGFITPCGAKAQPCAVDTTPITHPLNGYQANHRLRQAYLRDRDYSGADGLDDVYESRFSSPIWVYDRDGARVGRATNEDGSPAWATLPPLKNQWQHDWRRRVELGAPARHLTSGRFAFWGNR